MSGLAAGYQSYKTVDVETASQGKIIIMLFNGAMQRAEEAKRQLERNRIEGVHNNLIRAQEILGELRSALDLNTGGDIAKNLDRIYEYAQHLLIMANVRKDVKPIDECVGHLTVMRDTWKEVFENLAREQKPEAPQVNPHGATVMNFQG